MDLNKSSIKNLRAEAHRLKLKPVVMIGQNGLSDNVHQEIDVALSHHELIKIRVPSLESSDKKQLINLIAEKHAATLIQTIGHVAVLFRPNEEKNRFASLLK
ncbi:MAG: YhbY family RNA-binding protein [Gammaproteobacteria bacterium]|nr:YhbY family RNA-binding protein [Gammaproteobacteria bacterium]